MSTTPVLEAGPAGPPPPSRRGRPAARPYLAYAGRRLLQAAGVILLAYVITFVVLSVIGNNPIASQLANPQSGLGPDDVRRLESFYGVDKPVLERLWLDLSRFLRGELGISLQSRLPVGELIGTALPYTLKLAGLALALSLLFAGALAYASQRFPYRWGREAARSVPSLFLSVPNFVIGLFLIQVFAFQLHAFNVLEPDAFVGTLCAAAALAVPISAPLSEVLIANLDNESSQEYVLVARSRGLSEGRIFRRHLIKPSGLPAVTMAAIITGELMGGALVTEEVFGRTGVGTVMYSAVSTGDTPVLQAVVALAAVVFVVVNLLADLLAPLLDPRVEIVGPKSAPGLVRGLGRGFQAGDRLGTRA